MRFFLYLFLILLFSLQNCKRSLTEREIFFSNGKYYRNGTLKPFSGEILFSYPDGRVSDRRFFERGVPTHLYAYGYSGEVIIQNRFIPLSKESLPDSLVERVVLVEITEGSSPFYMIYIIVNGNREARIDDNFYNTICDRLMEDMENKGLFKGKREYRALGKPKLKVEVTKGEFFPPIFTKSY